MDIYYSSAATDCKPNAIASSSGTAFDGGWRHWWATESVRIGTHWIGIAETVTAIMSRLTACPTCGSTPCRNVSFCEACRDADARKARGETPKYIDPSRWRAPSEHIREGAPKPTVEALMLGLRERGTNALTEPKVTRRLSELSESQLHEIAGRLQRLKPEIARAWTADAIIILVDAWNMHHA
jgi:hypothetical protein